MREDVVVALKDAVGEPVLAHELPDVFGWIEFGRARRQGHQRDVLGHGEGLGAMPAGLIEDGVGAGGNLAGDLIEMQLHGAGVALG